MDHEAYEKQMIDTINRNAEEKSKKVEVCTSNSKVITTADKTTLKRGLKRTILALLTAIMFGFSVTGFITVATAPGYLAVLLFIGSLAALGGAFILLYAQGIVNAESKGDHK